MLYERLHIFANGLVSYFIIWIYPSYKKKNGFLEKKY